MKEWSIQDLERMLECEARNKGQAWRFQGVSIDSRTLREGDIFLALRGEQSDGHKHIADAREAGASAFVLERAFVMSGKAPDDLPVFPVDDTVEALHTLAKFRRELFTGKVLAVTGSNGKTSTKDMLSGMCARLEDDSAFATPGNFNNHLGLPLSMLRTRPDNRIHIYELGMNHAGEIASLSRLLRPDHALVTSVSGAHIGNFNSVEDIARAKLEIVEGLASGSTLVYNARSPGAHLASEICDKANLRCVLFEFDEEPKVSETGVTFRFNGEEVRNKNIFSRSMARNLLGGLHLVASLGYPDRDIAKAAAHAKVSSPGRFRIFRRKSGQERMHLLVDDSYNANPDSFRSSLEALRELLPEGRLALLAGEMAELGDHAPEGHREVGREAARLNYDFVGAVGRSCAKALLEAYVDGKNGEGLQAESPDQLLLALDRLWDPEAISEEEQTFVEHFDGILIKGSRKAGMEVLSDALKRRGYV